MEFTSEQFGKWRFRWSQGAMLRFKDGQEATITPVTLHARAAEFAENDMPAQKVFRLYDVAYKKGRRERLVSELELEIRLGERGG